MAFEEVTVCDACGSDWCWQGLMYCANARVAAEEDVPACQHINDRTGKQCARPEKMHTSRWSHAFKGKASRRRALLRLSAEDPIAELESRITAALAIVAETASFGSEEDWWSYVQRIKTTLEGHEK